MKQTNYVTFNEPQPVEKKYKRSYLKSAEPAKRAAKLTGTEYRDSYQPPQQDFKNGQDSRVSKKEKHEKGVRAEACKIDRLGEKHWRKCLIVKYHADEDTYSGFWLKDETPFTLPGNRIRFADC